jgi:hypothetical protein
MVVDLNGSYAKHLNRWRWQLPAEQASAADWEHYAERLKELQEYEADDEAFEAQMRSIASTYEQASPEEDQEPTEAERLAEQLEQTVRDLRSGLISKQDAGGKLFKLHTEFLLAEAGDFSEIIERSKEMIRAASAAQAKPDQKLPTDNDLMSLFDAIHLPELGGQISEDGVRRPSKHIKVKTLRAAIIRGDLEAIRPGIKNTYVTRKLIMEWLEKCRDANSRLISSESNQNTTKKQARSGPKDTGRSLTDRSALARASALNLVQKLKKPGSNTK